MTKKELETIIRGVVAAMSSTPAPVAVATHVAPVRGVAPLPVLAGRAVPPATVVRAPTVAPVSKRAAQTSAAGVLVGAHLVAPDGLAAKVGAAKDSRLKLPTGLFENFSTVVLVWPNGVESAVTEDVEGRSRFSRKAACEYSGAVEGQWLTFEETNAGYFAVGVSNGVAGRAKEDKPKTAARTGKAVPVGKFGAMFYDAPKTEPRAASPAQLAARARFAEMARSRAAAKRSGVVEPGEPLTPIYAQGNAKGARKSPAKNVGARQKAHADIAPVAIPVQAVPIAGIDAKRAALARHNASKAARKAAGTINGPVAVAIPKR